MSHRFAGHLLVHDLSIDLFPIDVNLTKFAAATQTVHGGHHVASDDPKFSERSVSKKRRIHRRLSFRKSWPTKFARNFRDCRGRHDVAVGVESLFFQRLVLH